MDDDLTVQKTEGFKVGEKKTIDEYQKLGMCRRFDLFFRVNVGMRGYSRCRSLILPIPSSHV